jgi:hypothetical protein
MAYYLIFLNKSQFSVLQSCMALCVFGSEKKGGSLSHVSPSPNPLFLLQIKITTIFPDVLILELTVE